MATEERAPLTELESRLVAESSRLAAGLLDADALLARVLELLVPSVGACGAADLVDRGSVVQVAIVRRDGRVEARRASPCSPPPPAARAIETGRSVLVTEGDERPASIRSSLYVPVRGAHGVVAGLSIGSVGDHVLGQPDVELVERVAAQVAPAVENWVLRRTLAAEREQLRALVDDLPLGVAFVDAVTHRTELNARGRQIAALAHDGDGLSLSEPDGRQLARDESPIARALAGEVVANRLVAVAAPDGQKTVLEVTARPLRDADGRVTAAIVVYDDVAGRERRERADQEFITNAAHQLRTPLTAIAAAVAVLQGGAKEIPEERDRFLGHLERETVRLGRLGRALLTLSRMQRGDEDAALAVVPLRPLLEEILAEQTPNANVAVDLDCPAEAAAMTNGDLLEEALSNLIANAYAYTDHGRVTITARWDAGTIVIEIADTGRGIPDASRPMIFERFYRAPGPKAAGRGFGLGLPIAKAAVEAAGGTLDIDSHGKGTLARVTLRGVKVVG